MKYEELISTMEKMRKLSEHASLPFLVNSNGKPYISWFYFNSSFEENKLVIKAKTAYTILNDSIVEIRINEQCDIYERDVKYLDECIYSEDEYINKLLLLNDNFDVIDNIDLMSKGIPKPKLILYKSISNILLSIITKRGG